MNIRRNHKDSIFRSLFRDRARFLELYNALKGAVYYGPDTEMVDTTLEDALIVNEINDVSFLIDGKLVVFVEHQSTINYNMPLRMLMYAGRVMEALTKSRDIYRQAVVEIPDAEFYVIYNGTDTFPEHKKLALSDMRCEERKKYPPKLELIVDIYNIYNGANPDLKSRSPTLGDYETFVEMLDRYLKTHDRADAIRLTIAGCRALGMSEEIIEIFAKGVENMIFTQFDLKEAREVWQEEGMELGMKQEKRKNARAMKDDGVDVNTIAKWTGLTVDEILKL